MAFYIVPKRKMISPEKETPAITIIEQIQEGDTYYTEYRADFPFRIRIPVGEDMYDSGAINQQTMTFYSDPDPERATVDGYVEHDVGTGVGDGVTWATLVAEAGTDADDTAQAPYAVYISAHTDTDKWRYLLRSIFLFDTSSLPDNCTITNATFSVMGSGYTRDGLGITPDINVYSSAPASDTALASGDFDSLGTTPLATAITYANFEDGINHFILNATGLASISKTGITKLGLRNANYDVAGTIPAWTSNESSRFGIGSADNPSLANRPRLTVTYEEYGGEVWIEDEKLHIISQTGTEQIALNESTFDANTILKADANDTPEALTIAVQRIIGRITAGEIDALTGAQALTILTGQANATFDWNSQNLTGISEITLTPKASSTGAEGTIFYDSDDDHIWVATE